MFFIINIVYTDKRVFSDDFSEADDVVETNVLIREEAKFLIGLLKFFEREILFAVSIFDESIKFGIGISSFENFGFF